MNRWYRMFVVVQEQVVSSNRANRMTHHAILLLMVYDAVA